MEENNKEENLEKSTENIKEIENQNIEEEINAFDTPFNNIMIQFILKPKIPFIYIVVIGSKIKLIKNINNDVYI